MIREMSVSTVVRGVRRSFGGGTAAVLLCENSIFSSVGKRVLCSIVVDFGDNYSRCGNEMFIQR